MKVKADFLRIYKSVHTWTGILSGMALFIAFYAGALTVFKEPLARWASPPAAVRAVPLAQAQDLIVKTLDAHPAAANNFTINLDDAEPARMQWQARTPHSDDQEDEPGRQFTATLDAAGAAQVDEVHPSMLTDFIDVLHRVVGLPVDNDPNRWIMGVVSALYALALVSGLVVLLPSLVKDLFALRVGKNIKRMWLDAHNVVGLFSLPFHIVMAITAVVFAFHDQIYIVQDKVVHEGKWATAFQRPKPKAGAPARDPAAMLAPSELVARARGLSPGFEPASLEYQQVTGPRPLVRVWGKDAAAVSPRAHGGFVALDPYTGKVGSTDFMPGKQNVPNLFISSFFALHMASFGGAMVQWLYFLLGLAGAWLFYSGNLLWIETRRKRAAAKTDALPVQRLDTRLMASASVGVCLGSVCGISLMLVASKWLHGHVDDLAFWLKLVYYATFFGAIAWAFLQGGARAGVHLLRTAVLLTLAIPLTTLLAWLLPGAGPWAHTSPAALGVDFTALAGALGFAWMARAAARRGREGGKDSVWSTVSQPEQGGSRRGQESDAVSA
jgi:uncharacterized iron-regulated membrane protein